MSAGIVTFSLARLTSPDEIRLAALAISVAMYLSSFSVATSLRNAVITADNESLVFTGREIQFHVWRTITRLTEYAADCCSCGPDELRHELPWIHGPPDWRLSGWNQ